MAVTSTRGVRMLSTVTSPNCSAEEISSPCSSSRLPSSVMSSMISYSSSSVTVISGSPLESFAAPRPIAVSSAESGAKSFISTRIAPAQESSSFSLYFLPRLFGSISPRKNTTIVVTIVLRVTKLNPQRRVTATVTIEATAICTMFVPIRIVVIARSKLSSRNSASFARVSPRSAAVLIFVRDAEAMAVSVTAKYMAQNKSMIAMIHGNRLPSSIMRISISFWKQISMYLNTKR